MKGARYRLVVQGELGPPFAAVFEGMRVEAHEGMTVIVGTIEDQAHLHGLLDRIASLGIELVSVAPELGPEETAARDPSG